MVTAAICRDQSRRSRPIERLGSHSSPFSLFSYPLIIPSLITHSHYCMITRFWHLTCREMFWTDEQSGWITWLMAGEKLFCFGCLKGLASWSGAVLKSDLLWKRLRAARYHLIKFHRQNWVTRYRDPENCIQNSVCWRRLTGSDSIPVYKGLFTANHQNNLCCFYCYIFNDID